MRPHPFKAGQVYKALSSFKSKGFAPSDDDYEFVAGQSYRFLEVRYNHYDGVLIVFFKDIETSDKLIWYWDDHKSDDLCYEFFDLKPVL